MATDRHPLLGKTSASLGVMLLALALPYASHALRSFRIVPAPWDRAPPPAETAPAAAVLSPTAPAVGETTLGSSNNEGRVTNALPTEARPPGEKAELDPQVLAKLAGSLAIEDPTGVALDAFYTRLARTIRKEPGATTRVMHYGDSLITSDFISGTMRRLMQSRFGDGGHGFILIANPWEWYFHNDVYHKASDGWIANRITGPGAEDGLYGPGGVSFHAAGGTWAWFSTVPEGDYGRKVSRFDIYYLEQPWGGDMLVTAPGMTAERFTTRGDKKVSRVHSVKVPDGAGEITIRPWGNGDSRLFGVALERDTPGIVYDALGANGARIRLLLSIKAEHWAEQIALRDPGLIVLQYGTNESEDSTFDAEAYEKSLNTVVERVKAAAPSASILIASPLDRAERGARGELVTRKIIHTLVDAQRRAALAHGCAFWSTFEAMGGEGSMARWVNAKPQLGAWDLTHPTPEGAAVIGDLLFKAITSGYEAFASRHRDAAPLDSAR